MPKDLNWNVKTLNEHLSKLIDERDRTYQQRWEAQEKALIAALSAAEKAVSAALTAQERAVAAALSSTERAGIKAEIASEKRFDSVNEFRGQLTDQAATFITRSEFNVSITSLGDKISTINDNILDKVDSHNKSITDRIDDLKVFKDTTSGKIQGINVGWIVVMGVVSLLGGIMSIVSLFRSLSLSAGN